MKTKKIRITTHDHCQMIDISRDIQEFLLEAKADDGLLTIFVPHTTAAVTINENADPDVQSDLLSALKKLADDRNYRHAEGNSDAHLKSTITGCAQTVLIQNGQPLLGTWQSVFFCEFDGPRNRSCILSLLQD